MRNDRQGGFSLLEVMAAVAILAVSLTAIFSSEGVALRAGELSTEYNVATLLARCKMAEIEELVASEGLPADHRSGRDDCCEDGEHEGYTCEWNIDRVELPDDGMMGGEGEGVEAGGAAESLSDTNAQTAAIDMALGGAGGGDGFTEMALGIAFPILKPAIEDQVRRASVTISWGSEERGRSFEIVQYLVAEQPPAQEDPQE